VVGLDPSYGDDSKIVLSSPYFGMYPCRHPLLTLRSGHETYTARARDAALDALPLTDRYTADVGRSTHGDFGDDVVVEAALSLDRKELRTTAEGIAAYRATAGAVRQFLDGVLGGKKAALDSLAAAKSGVLRMTKTAAAPIPSSDEWEQLLRRNEVSALTHKADDLAAAYPKVPVVVERDLNRAGYRLMQAGESKQAAKVLLFNALTHPTSANAFDSLAEGCEAARDKAGEVAAYQKVLRVLPSDKSIPDDVKERMRTNAESKLKELGAPAH
jgi:hypothetical protein